MRTVLPDTATRKVLLTFIGAGIAAVFAEHLIKPKLKKGLFL